MADLNKLNKLNSGNYQFKNPYTETEKTSKDTYKPKSSTPAEPRERNVFELNGYNMGRFGILEDEITKLKMDIVTLLQLIEDNLPNMSIQAVRQKYSDFRAHPEHVCNRVIKNQGQITRDEFNNQ